MGIKLVEGQQPMTFCTGFLGLRESARRLASAMREIVVVARVRGAGGDFQIRNAIIQFVAVLVMNNLAACQRAAKVLLHQIAMFKDFLTVDVEHFITATQPSLALIDMVRIAMLEPTEVVFVAPTACFGDIVTIRNRALHGYQDTLTSTESQEEM